MKTNEKSRSFFTGDEEVQKVIQALKAECGELCEQKHISDVYDEEGHPYVNLVQEGGGVLGIALVGYTYALESVGIRFLKLAGTSAGAINTLLLATVVPENEQSTKSEKILDYLSKQPLFDFVDAHWFVRWLIKRMITTQNSIKRIEFLSKAIVAIAILGPILAILLPAALEKWLPDFVAREKSLAIIGIISQVVLVVSIIAEILLIGFVCFTIYLWRRFKKNRWGIAKGEKFREWINSILKAEVKPGVVTVEDFENHVRENAAKDLWLAPGYFENGNIDEDKYKADWGRNNVDDLINPSFSTNPGWVTFITSDITTQNKIELPRMWPLYRTEKSKLEIADFVRASMSIPVFFSIHKISNIPSDQSIRDTWESKDYLNYPKGKKIPSEVCLVDGGTLSNFPINVFFNPNVTKPRLPTFGIRLGEGSEINQRFLSVWKYLASLFGTIRFHYDKDFQLKHADFMKSTTVLKVDKFNWLNFNLTDEEQLELFRIGVRAAYDFLTQRDPRQSPVLDAAEPEEEIAAEELVDAKKGFDFGVIQQDRPELLKKLQEAEQ